MRMQRERQTATVGRRTLMLLILLLGLQVVFAGIVTLASALPREPIEAHLAASESDALLNGYFDYSKNFMGSHECHDNNRYIVDIALQDDQGNAFSTAMTASITDVDWTGLPKHYQYFRYWHGWQLLTNLCLEIGGIQVVAVVVFMLEAAAAVWLFLEMRRRIGNWPAAIFVFVLSASTGLIWGFASDLLLGISFATIMASCASALFAGRHFEGMFPIAVVALIGGAVFNFLDFYTVPALAIAAVTYCCGITKLDDGTKGFLKTAAVCAGAFLLGFAFTWISKWAFAGFVLGFREVFADVIGEAGLWTAGGVTAFEGHRMWALIQIAPRLYPIFASLAVAAMCPAGITAAILCVVLLVRCGVKGGRKALGHVLLLSLPLLFVPLFCMLANVHAIEHTSIFTFRLWAATFAILCCSAMIARQNRLSVADGKPSPTNQINSPD